MRVAFTMVGGRHWTGGYNYLLNLFRVLSKHGSGQVQPVLFIGEDFPKPDLAPFAAIGCDIVRSEAFDKRRQNRTLVSALITGKDRKAERIFQAQRIDAVFEVASFLGWRFAIPAIAWIPDFQHRHLPDMFSQYAYWRRELGLRAQIHSGRAIMLSSEDARASCEHFYPSTRGRTKVVPFAVMPDETLLALDPEEVRTRHGLPKQFVYLPNQFWKHKNHRLAVEALSKLNGQHVVIATTGQSVDPRHPELYSELQGLVGSKRLDESFRFLGMVPYAEVVALMRAATAVLNPSLFEGWSTTVEEARALGVPLILSDLAVHKEQMGDTAKYFSPTSPEQLAEILIKATSEPAEDRLQREDMAQRAQSARLQAYARNFEAVVEKLVVRA